MATWLGCNQQVGLDEGSPGEGGTDGARQAERSGRGGGGGDEGGCGGPGGQGGSELGGGPLRLTLPPELYAVPGITLDIYYDDIVLTERPESYAFDVDCDLGTSEGDHWTLTPAPSDEGDWPLAIRVRASDGTALGAAATTLRVLPADAGEETSIRLLFVGDSLTAATWYVNEVASYLSAPGNPAWEMLGTKSPPWSSPGVAHEGYGGSTWTRFATHYEPDPNGLIPSSPFVLLGPDGQPALDTAGYFDASCSGEPPDIAFFLLGINDCFGANPDDSAAIDTCIDGAFFHAESLLADLRNAAPDIEIGIGLTTPPNARESAFHDNYQGSYHRWGWKRIQHRMVEREIIQFGNRERERVFVVPTELNLNPWTGFHENDAVHPNIHGYAQIGTSVYTWLKWRLHARTASAPP